MSDIRQLGPRDTGLMDAVSTFFGEAFADPASYTARRPGARYLRKLLAGDSFITLAALEEDKLYTKLGAREDVLHFDIPVTRTKD